ncbi:uncharacterized protein LOC113684861 [Pocillopora damicornis]|uniref:uncharacterized protein LOC113684861 n=1 Tax=Pocillopora damicornis TaxID=46731 RepID=UPI000F5503DC|nr:uncharacterized protein LOC113684861 [Pocillopora damicornis]
MTEKITADYESELENQRKQLNAVTNKIMDADVERKAAALTKAEQENSSLEESIKKDKLEVKAFRESIKEHERTEQQIEKDFENARLEFASVMNERQTEIDYIKIQIADLQTKLLNHGKQNEEKNEKGFAKKPNSLKRRVTRFFRSTTD